MEKMKELVSGTNTIAKPVYDECVEKMTAWELNKVEM